MSEWDQKFMAVDQEMLFEIISAANYMDIKPLLDCGCKTVANMIKGKTPDEIRKTFNIVKDFTPEEEAQIRRMFFLMSISQMLTIMQERTSGQKIDNVATCMMLAILPQVAMMKFTAILCPSLISKWSARTSDS